MNDIKTYIYDFDGTLADTIKGIVLTEWEVMRHFGLPLTPESQIKLGIGLPLRDSLKVGGLIPEELADEAVIYYRAVWNDIATPHLTPFPGVKEALAECHRRGSNMAIATSRGSCSLIPAMEAFGIKEYFTEVVAGDSGLAPKPQPDMLIELMRRFGSKPEETMMVGDTTYDLEMGKAAGCHTCGVTYGNHTREMLQSVSPDIIVDSLTELF